jgi:hypothetical protein
MLCLLAAGVLLLLLMLQPSGSKGTLFVCLFAVELQLHTT